MCTLSGGTSYHENCTPSLSITQLFLLIWISNNFRDSCMGIIKNEQSNLKLSLSQKTQPYYVSPSHTCMDCVSRMCSCNHPCCKEWFIKAGFKCGFIQKIEGSSPGVTQYIIRDGNSATSVSETNALGLSQIFSSPLTIAASLANMKDN